MKTHHATTSISVKPLPSQNSETQAVQPSAASDSMLLLSSGPTTSGISVEKTGDSQPLPERLQRIGAALTSIFNHAHLLWPGQSWNTFQVVIVDSAQGRAWIWNDQSLGHGQGGLAEIDFHALPASLQEMLGDGTFRGNPAMSVDIALFPDAAGQVSTPSFIIHELFHERIQKPKFVLPTQPDTERWPRYPLSAEPRYLRNELIESLRRAFLAASPSERQAALSEAAYWHVTYKSRFPQEALETAYTELLEMPAQHAESMAMLIARYPECVTEEALIKQAKEHPELFDSEDRFEKNIEPYQLSTWSGLLLRDRNRLSDFAAIERGEYPLDVLLRGIEPALNVPDNDDNRLAAQQKAAEANAHTEQAAKPVFEQFALPGNTRVLLPFSWRFGGFIATSPTTLTDKPGQPTLLPLATFEIHPPQGGSLEVQGANLLLYESHPLANTPGTMAAFVVPPKGLSRAEDGSFTIDGSIVPGLVGTGLKLKEVIADDGLRWLVPVETPSRPA